MKALLLLVCALLFGQLATAQTFTGTGGAIPDNNTVKSFPIPISGLNAPTLSGTFRLESVCLSITHPFLGDLQVQLKAPSGQLLNLAMNVGGSGDNFTSTCFSSKASTSITDGTAPFSGSFRPVGNLDAMNNGQASNGTWSLLVRDTNAPDAGALVSWRLSFVSTLTQPLVFTSSNLPIVVINTGGRTIVDNPKVDAYMGIINNGAGERNQLTDAYSDYHNKIGIELRGSSSLSFPQKSYSIETRDMANVEHDTTVLGMPAENAWILYAPYDDKSCLRNVFTYDIANKMGHYASRTRFCELMLDGKYQGIYVMMEKIKRDANRVDIKKIAPTDITGNKLTGGYIFKIDRPSTVTGNTGWRSSHLTPTGATVNFLYEYPKDADIVPQQAAYLKAYVDSVENALAAPDFANPTTGYAKYIDVNSFIDYLIINEISKNVDGYRLSTFLHKKRRSEGGKVFAGPVWDYNLGWRNADYCTGDLTSGWAYDDGCSNDAPFWWKRLLQDPNFTNALKCRWKVLRQGTLQTDTLNKFIDATADRLGEAKDRHFTAWPILGVYTWPNPQPIAPDYPTEIDYMKQWVRQRLAWLDANLPGLCNTVTAVQPAASPAPVSEVYPNPFNQELRFKTRLRITAPVRAELRDIAGRTVAQVSYGPLAAGPRELAIKTPPALAPGIYFLQVSVAETSYNFKVVKE